MSNLSLKITNFFLIIVGLLLMMGDVFHKDKFYNTRIKVENFILIRDININNIFAKIYSVKYILSSYINDIDSINTILADNARLNEEVSFLRQKLNSNDYFIKIKEQAIYEKFEFIPIEIINQDKNYGIIQNINNKIKKDSIVINECGIMGKISNNGNQISIVMLTTNQKFVMPVKIGDQSNTGIYSFLENKIVDAKDKFKIRDGDLIVSFEQKDRIPNGIPIGKVRIKNGAVEIDRDICKNQSIGFVLNKIL